MDELGREAGMTVRTVRSHQAQGLLAPPEVRARAPATTAPSTSRACG